MTGVVSFDGFIKKYVRLYKKSLYCRRLFDQFNKNIYPMRILKAFSIIIVLVGLFQFGFAQQHPRILVNEQEKQQILNRIENHSWAQKIYQDMKSEVKPYVDRHQSNPEWILSRYLMNWKEGAHYTEIYSDPAGTKVVKQQGNAPVPTVRVSTHKRSPVAPDGYNFRVPEIKELKPYDTSRTMKMQTRGPSGKWYNADPQRYIGSINGRINRLALKSAIIYWLTGEEKYAKFAADIIIQWARGAYYQDPIQGACRDGYLSIQSLGDANYKGAILAYDFIYDYLISEVSTFSVYDGNGYESRSEIELSVFDTVFVKMAKTQVERGFRFNNWFAHQSSTLVTSALAIDDEETREKYLEYFLTRDYANGSCGQFSIAGATERFFTHQGHWIEPAGYHNMAVNGLLEASLMVENNGYKVFGENPQLFKASYALLRYAFPNGRTLGFGDTGGGPTSPENLEIAIVGAKKYDSPVTPILVNELHQMIEEGHYSRSESGYLGLLSYTPEIKPMKVTDAPNLTPRADSLGFAKCYIQRNSTDEVNGLMYSVYGATYNHNNADGMSIELYGPHYVMGRDPGSHGYDTDIYVEYYARWAAHNTVVAEEKSAPFEPFRGGGGAKQMGEIELLAMEPEPEKEALSSECSYTYTHYVDSSTNTKQRRHVGLIRTSNSSGYYVDVYRSDNPRGNDYLYHNIGHSLNLYDEEDKELSLSSTDKLSGIPGPEGPGYTYFENKHTTGNYHEDIQALFSLKAENEDVAGYMKVFMTGDDNREYFKVEAPRTRTAPEPFYKIPTPTFVARKNGEAWNHPFVSVYEPYKGNRTNGSVRDIEEMSESSANENYTGVEVSSYVNGEYQTQFIHTGLSGNSVYENNNQIFRGIFGVISLVEDELEYLYLGNGQKIQYNGCSINSPDSEKISAYLRQNADGWVYSGKQAAQVSLRYYNTDDKKQYEDLEIYLKEDDQLRKIDATFMPDKTGATEGWGTIRFRMPAIEETQITIR